MSGRIRSVKPEWLDDEKIAMASPEARVLSVSLLLLADDYGNGRANQVMLQSRVFPGMVGDHAERALSELVSIGYVITYTVGGQRYFSIRNWEKHQRVEKKGKPKVPPPPALTDIPGIVGESSGNVPGKVGEDSAPPPASRASISLPTPDPKSDLPDRSSQDQQHRDRLAESLTGKLPHQRPDVQRVFAGFAGAFGYTGAKLTVGDVRADQIAERIDAHSEAACLLVVKYAPQDGMVNGKADERGHKHETVKYIFGNADTFDRILRFANEREGTQKRRRSASELLREAQARR